MDRILSSGTSRSVHLRRQSAAAALKSAADEGSLNSSQYIAAEASLNRRLTLIHGPPGTGKTHTTVALVRQWVAGGAGPVLVASDSNTAVDNLVDGLTRFGVRVVRLGRPEAIRQDLNRHTLDSLVAEQGCVGHAKDAIYQAQQQIMRSAQVVACTCSGAGADLLEKFTFPSVIIDEASQATEPSVLVPLQHGAGQLVLVGDHKQLPATVLSREAELGGLALSLFDRLVASGATPFLLDTQYRMHPSIASYSSLTYYSGRVRSGISGSKRPAAAGFRWPQPGIPVAFVPVEGREVSEGGGHSYFNDREADEVASCVMGFVEAGMDPGDIGVITPYAAQVRVLRRRLQRYRGGVSSQGLGRFGRDGEDATSSAKCIAEALPPGSRGFLEVNSVDGFQGREKEVIVVSAVRASSSGGVGFLSDIRRMNVTLTRARRGIVVFGSIDTLWRDQHCWSPWLTWANRHGLIRGREHECDQHALQALRQESENADQHHEPPPKRAMIEDSYAQFEGIPAPMHGNGKGKGKGKGNGHQNGHGIPPPTAQRGHSNGWGGGWDPHYTPQGEWEPAQ
eukprot:Hpha_TRINITY_DN15687_c3_g2::TRINITY_DN15687_c3_g2_i1::g.99073::m.99073/K14326/UPF1, RENT1; regulator of nonsense transcripts 1